MNSFVCSLIGVLFLFGSLFAQEIPIDASFHYLERDAGSGFNGKISVVIPLLDGKHLVGGEFSTYNGKTVPRLIRLFPDGQLDPSFQPDMSFSRINTIRVQTDGKILIGGDLKTQNDSEFIRIVRLNPDGDIDDTFQTDAGINGEVIKILVQTDGNILVGGQFTSYRGETVPSLIRIHPDGARDKSYNPEVVTDVVHDFAFQADGMLLVNFSNKLIRLYPDGSKDDSFQLAAPYGTTVFDPDHPEDGFLVYQFKARIYPQEDGKILVQGDMRNSRRESTYYMRLLPDGSIDKSFEKHDSNQEKMLLSLTKNQDGKLFRLDGYYEFNPLLPDGTVEESVTLHDLGSEQWNLSQDILEVQKDGKFLVVGELNRNKVLLRFNIDGSLDQRYNATPEFNQQVSALALQQDGKILAGGKFTSYNGTLVNSLARIHPDGTLDETFNAGKGLGLVDFRAQLTILVQRDERIVVVGSFNTFDGNEVGGIVRLNPDGSRDESFQTGTGFNFSSSLKVLLQDDGKIIVATQHTNSFNGVPFQSLIRLNPDGSRDPSFDIGSGFDWSVISITQSPGDKILVGGNFTTFNGNPANGLVRLNPNGSLDPTFDVKEKPGIPIKSLVVQEDGKILAIGADGITTLKSRLLRFNSDGSPDLGFKSEIPPIYPIGTLTLQSDNKILLSTGQYADYLARLLPDGRIDPTFKLIHRFNGAVETMVLDLEGNLLAGGNFTSFKGIRANRIARIPTISEQPAPLSEVIRINAGGPSLQSGSEEWLADMYFSGGRAYSNPIPIANTGNEALYQTERFGEFSYEIPVPQPGVYTVELHFAEIHWGRSNARIFDLFVENHLFRSNIDLARDIGINTASVLRIENVEVKDGNLSLELLSRKDRAKISGIALFKQDQTEVPRTIRINAGGEALYYVGEEWLADRYYQGGQSFVDDSTPISNTTREKLFHSERYGKFNYRIPAPKAGRYVLELYFAEILWNSENKRVFDVLIENGQHRLENLDLVQTIGEPNRAYTATFGQGSAILEIMDGALDLEFIPRVNEAKLSGLSMTRLQPETWAPILTQPEDIILEEGQEWSYQIDASSQKPGNKVGYYAVGLPDGVTLDPDTGQIRGIFSSAGRYTIALKVTDQDGPSAYADFTVIVNPLTVVARINAGGGTLQFGEEQWQADSYFSGGRAYSTKASISNTTKEALYQTERNGDFSYNIPVPEKGLYMVELHFSEIHWNRANARLFQFRLENGQPGATIDLFIDHGGANNAYVLRATNIQVNDGALSIELITGKDRAKISGIVVYKQEGSRPPGLNDPYRINVGGPTIFYGAEEWVADTYFEGGRTYKVSSAEIGNSDNDALYHSERYGNFNYRLPAPGKGLYTVELHFAEIFWDRQGARVFSVDVEDGQFVKENVDLIKDYGGKNTASVMRAENINVTDGTLDIQFLSQVNNAKLSGISFYKQDHLAAQSRIDPAVISRDQQETEETGNLASDGRGTAVLLYPNPARGKIRLEFEAEQNGVWNFVLVNSQGISTYLDRVNLEKGRHRLDFDLTGYNFGAGTYYLQLLSDRSEPKVVRVILH